MEQITISNGEEFFRIPVDDLKDAKGDGFYVPGERGMTIVSNDEEIFELPLDDAPEAVAEGYRDLLQHEREQWSQKRRQKSARLPSTAKSVTQGAGVAAPALVGTAGVSIDTGEAAFETGPVSLFTDEAQAEIVADPVLIEADEEDAIDVFAAEEVKEVAEVAEATREAYDEEEAELRRMQEEELEEATGVQYAWLYFKYRMLPEEEVMREFMTAYGTSAIICMMVMLVLGMWILKGPDEPQVPIIDSSMTDSVKPTDEEDPEPVEVEVPEMTEADEPTEIASEEVSDVTLDVDVSDLKPANMALDLAAVGPAVSVPIVGPLAGRSKAGRKSAVTKYGGSPGSESAVNAALNWLARHQLPDGSWSFNHGVLGCGCTQPGTQTGNTGSTGFALLTMMGAGNTFCDGEYKKSVQAGITYLLNNMNVSSSGWADLRGGPDAGHGGIYAHGLATSALCEALAMNAAYLAAKKRDRDLELRDGFNRKIKLSDLEANQKILGEASQLAINYTIHHMDKKVGGFGYTPGSAGDTSIHGWQMMGLTSGKMANLNIPQIVWKGCYNYLDTVQANGGAYYGYRGPQKKDSTTAIGLLCRMYQGWSKTHPPFVEGVKYLSQHGPSPNDMYFNYYATQVLFHWGDDGKENLWTKWNNVMREQLVRTQAKAGHAVGSWNVADKHGAKGGRLFMTCMAAMTLEIYYRKLPIYKKTLEGQGADENEKP